MSGYKVTFARSARKELQTLSIDVAKRVLEKIETLEVNARPTGSKKLSGAKDLWRLRVGDYRVVGFKRAQRISLSPFTFRLVPCTLC